MNLSPQKKKGENYAWTHSASEYAIDDDFSTTAGVRTFEFEAITIFVTLFLRQSAGSQHGALLIVMVTALMLVSTWVQTWI